MKGADNVKLISRLMDAIALGGIGFILGYNYHDQALEMTRRQTDRLIVFMFVGFVIFVVLSEVIKAELSRKLTEVGDNTK